ncbi:Conserved oligomeric Golgi complex subunit 3 [Plasmodiophora brassicae]|uniref:Conserved oligomeric Golgi complex subunit 3 n=2 Tax=Plasmodiophora brassicae TaxID=37360 RepID=A0A3P3XZS6_PLABS|nr:unnamed protein product [Plasmodiophora brassicae]
MGSAAAAEATLSVREAMASWDANVDSREGAALARSLQACLDRRPRRKVVAAEDVAEEPAADDILRKIMGERAELQAEPGPELADLIADARLRLETVTRLRATLSELLGLVHQASTRLDAVLALNVAVESTTNEIRDACTTLTASKDELLAQADYLREVLSHFDDAGRIVHRLSLAVNFSPEEWATILARIDQCISFMSEHLDSTDARQHLVRFQQLRTRALTKLCAHISSLILEAAAAPADSGLIEMRAAAVTVQPRIALLEQRRLAHPEYEDALLECVQVYYNTRHSILYETTAARLVSLSASSDLGEFARSACMHLLTMCSVESRLFVEFFHDPFVRTQLEQLVSSMCSVFYMQIRPRIIYEEDLDALADVVNIIRVEILDEQVAPRGEDLTAIVPALNRTVEDVQERLIYRAQVFIRAEISGFIPSADDLDYPAKVNVWFPTLERCLLLLSKVYRSVERHVFEMLAQDAVAACITSLRSASRTLPDPHLFLIKHFVILREQIAPFDADFATVERALDLSHVTDSFRMLVSGHLPSLTLTHQVEVDSKRDVERDLKAECEKFIEQATQRLTHFARQSTDGAPSPRDDQERLRNARDTIMKSDDGYFVAEFAAMREKLSLYLNNAFTERIILKPIKDNVLHVASELRKVFPDTPDLEIRLATMERIANTVT